MSRLKPVVKIIIPSIGRKSLGRILIEIAKDSRKIANQKIAVIIISDGQQAFEKNREQVAIVSTFLDKSFIVYHYKNPKQGVSSALNFGLQKVQQEDLFMIFNDDDEWIPGRLALLVSAILKEKKIDLILSKAILSDENGSRLRPIRPITPGQEILEYLYEGVAFKNNPSYFSLVTCIAKGPTASVFFREGVTSHEDVIWLADLQRSGFVLKGIDAITANLNVSLERSSQRMNSGEDEQFFAWFKNRNPKLFTNYIWIHAQRANSSQAKPLFVLKFLFKNFKTNHPNLKQFTVGILIFLFTLIKFIKKSIFRFLESYFE